MTEIEQKKAAKVIAEYWNGRKNPFMYTVRVNLSRDGQEVDYVEQPLGLRYFSVDPDKGFFVSFCRTLHSVN